MPRINVWNIAYLLVAAAAISTAAAGERRETLNRSRISSFADNTNGFAVVSLGINGTGKSEGLGINGTGKSAGLGINGTGKSEGLGINGTGKVAALGINGTG
jgi:hypothetical protein